MSLLRERFQNIKRNYPKPTSPSIFDDLRNCVAPSKSEVAESYSPDPDLDVRRRDKGCVTQWNEEYAKAQNIMPKFNRELATAIRKDELLEGKDVLYDAAFFLYDARNSEKTSKRPANVTKDYVQKYFNCMRSYRSAFL